MPARYEQIADWAIERGWREGVELGVFDGRTFLYLLKVCPDLKITGVDVWGRPTPQGATISGERCMCPYCSETRASRKSMTIEFMERYVKGAAVHYGDRAKVLTVPTWDAAQLFADGSLDFVFVDADHSTEGVRADIMNWAPKVKPSGMLIGHDYNMKSVRDAVAVTLMNPTVYADDHLWSWEPRMGMRP